VAVTALASMLFVFVFNYAQHGSSAGDTEALNLDRASSGDGASPGSVAGPSPALLEPHTARGEQRSIRTADAGGAGGPKWMGGGVREIQTPEMSLAEGNVSLTADGEESDSDELPEELRDDPQLPPEERRERQLRRQEYLKEWALRTSAERESKERVAGTCEPPCVCLVSNVTCRKAYCSTQVKWPNKGPPMRELGFPLQASESKTKILTKDEFIRNKQMPLPKELPVALVPHPHDIFRGLDFRQLSCAIVGNAGHLSLSNYGKEIDSHDVVVRLNQAPTKGYEDKVGSKTTMRLLNALWSQNYGNAAMHQKYELPLEHGVTLITSRGENLVRNFKMTRLLLQKMGRKDVQTYLIAHRMVTKTKILLTIFRNCLFASNTQFTGGRVPSSGLVSIYALKDLCKHTTAYGFGDHPGARYQYYVLHGTQRSSGNPTHSFGAEAALMRALAMDKLITVCNPGGCIGAPRSKAVTRAAI